MKKIIVSIILGISLLLVGCGALCGSKPPKRAYIFEEGAYGKVYHIGVYVPARLLSHNPTACSEYEYTSFHLYLDHLGEINGDEIIWKNFQGGDIPLEENGEIRSNIVVKILKDKVIFSGFNDNANNGEYTIEQSSPESWGVPLS